MKPTPDEPRNPKSFLGWLVAIPSVKSALLWAIIVAVVSALFFTWLGYQWHHGPVP